MPPVALHFMLISDSRQFVFVHLQKNAGTSMVAVLQPHAIAGPRSTWYSLLRALGLPRDYRRYKFREHAPLREAQARMPAERFASYFKFGFVRNPWDRLVSDYAGLLQNPSHRRHRRARRLADFAAFIEWEAQRGKRVQLDLLCDRDGRMAADFVGRFENVEADFAEVCGRLGIAAELPHRNRSNRGDYREWYDDRTREMVRQYWRADIETFGYEF
jgi:hypothetical protein